MTLQPFDHLGLFVYFDFVYMTIVYLDSVYFDIVDFDIGDPAPIRSFWTFVYLDIGDIADHSDIHFDVGDPANHWHSFGHLPFSNGSGTFGGPALVRILLGVDFLRRFSSFQLFVYFVPDE